jgi:hypothetical protein
MLPKEDKKFIQEVIGTFLYYGQCGDSTMLASLGSIATQQANPTKNTMKKERFFLDYASTHPDVIVTYHTSDMVLRDIVTHHTSPNKRHTTLPNHQTMAPSSQLRR